MKNLNIWQIIVFMFAAMIVYVFVVNITAMVVFKIPTTEANFAIRTKLLESLNLIIGFVLGIVAKKIYDDNTNKP